LGRLLATALCAVPLLIPVSALIYAQERPRCLRNTILSASTSACSAELCITIRLYLDRMMGLTVRGESLDSLVKFLA